MLQTYCSDEKDNTYNSKVRLNSLSILIFFTEIWYDQKWNIAEKVEVNSKLSSSRASHFIFSKLIFHSSCMLLFLSNINLSTIGLLFSTMISKELLGRSLGRGLELNINYDYIVQICVWNQKYSLFYKCHCRPYKKFKLKSFLNEYLLFLQQQ